MAAPQNLDPNQGSLLVTGGVDANATLPPNPLLPAAPVGPVGPLPDPEDVSQAMQSEAQLTIKDILTIRERSQTTGGKAMRRRKRGPRSATSAFGFFRMDHEVLSQICDENPNATPEEVMHLVESKWAMLSEEQKERYVTKQLADEQRYDYELKLYTPKSQGGLMKRRKQKKHPEAPKHPMSAYLYFVADHRQKLKDDHPDKGFTEIARILGEQWRALDPERKQQYESRASADKERYKREKEAFQPPPSMLMQSEAAEREEEELRRKKHPLAPKHPLSAYLIFVATNRPKMNAEHPDKDFTEVAQILGQAWKNLSPQERRKYEILAYADKKRYEEEKEKWTPPVDADAGRNKRARLAPPGAMLAPGPLDQIPPGMARKLPPQPYAPAPFWETPVLGAPVGGAMLPLAMVPKDARLGYLPPVDERKLYMEQPRSRVLDPTLRARGRPRRFTQANEVLSWNSHEIGRFIASLGLAAHKDRFVKSNITGEQFVKLTSPQLRDQFQIANIGDRKRIIKGIANLIK